MGLVASVIHSPFHNHCRAHNPCTLTPPKSPPVEFFNACIFATQLIYLTEEKKLDVKMLKRPG